MGRQLAYIEPARNALAITKSDTAKLPHVASKGISVNVAGDIAVRFVNQADNATAIVLTVVAGVLYPYHIKWVLSTGTTATGITVFFD